MSPRQFAGIAAALVLAGGSLRANTGVAPVSDSPFAPLPDAAGNAPGAPADVVQLAGASATGQGTQVCLYNAQTKRSNWIPVGSSRDGIQVLSFDPDRDQAVVSMNGERKILSLRKATVTPGPAVTYAPAFSPAPIQAPPPAVDYSSAPPPATAEPTDPKSLELARQQREARMMVSDLMEIGMQQRKAYAEALKRQAALQGGSSGQ